MTFSLHNPALLGLLLVVALVVAIVLLVAVAVFLWKARRKEEEEAEGTEQEKLERELLAGTPGMAESFREALRRIKERTPGWGYPYKAPWFVLVGEAGSGKSRIADQISGLSADLIPSGDAEFAPRWLLLDQAVLIDLPGMSFHPASAPETEKQALSTRELAAARCAWQSFLHQTVRCRPREPLNGIVLTLPATDLLVAVTDPDHQRRIARIAGIAQRMDEVQQLTGLSLPVYILVTKCDVLPSFNAFAHSLFARVAQGGAEAWSAESGEVQDDLFGWSNPYALEQEYSPAWVEEAFAATRTVLLRHQLEMLSQSQTAADADHIFLFPFELQQLQEPLQVLLNLVFRRTAFRASHRLRGVYFCGETREDDDKPGQLLQLQSSTALLRLPERPANRICFARNLFEYKVFAERYLAAPAARFFLRGNRSLLAARVVACLLVLLLGFGTIHAGMRISALQQHTIDPILEVLTQSLDGIALSSNEDVKPAVDLLNMLGASREGEFKSLAMPYSYLDIDGLRRNLHSTMEHTFEIVILHSCEHALERRVAALMNEGPRVLPASAPPTTGFVSGDSWSLDPSYRALQSYLAALKALNQNIDRYGMISGAGTGSFTQLNELLHYLGGRGLPDSSRFAQDPYYRRLLLDAAWHGLRLPPNYDSATEGVSRHLISGFYRSWFDTNPMIVEVQSLAGAEGLGILSASQSPPSNVQIHAFVSRAKALDQQLNSGSFDWLAEDFNRERYPALSGDLNGLSFADHDFIENVTAEGTERLNALRTALQTSPQVLNVQDGRVRLSGQVRALDSVLDALQGYELMASETVGAASGGCRLIPRGTMWNQADLSKALQMDAARAKIESELLVSLPSPYREQVRALVRGRTSNAIYQVLQNAALPVPRAVSGESSLEAELQNFAGSIDQLKQIGEELAALHATADLSCLNRSLSRQAGDLLAQVNQELPGLYSPSGSADMIREGQPLSLTLYEVSAADDLQAYLGSERQKIESLTASAAPLVLWLHSEGGHSEVLARWRSISQDVAALQAKKPGNAIQSLENYISGDLDKVTPAANCHATALRASNDLFLAVRSQLAQIAVSACHQIAVLHFNHLAAEFNQRLAGHFPFSTGMDLRPGAEASVADIAAFYQSFDSQSPGLTAVLPGVATRSDEALSFLSAVEAARPLVTGTAALPEPALSLGVQFRGNRNREILGDRIAGWSLQVGQQTVNYPPGPGDSPPLLWSYGDPVSLSVRYANNAAEVPAAANPSAAAQVRERSVTYSYRDAWSILSLLRDHRAGSIDARNLYQIRIPNRNGTASSAAPPPDTVVYLELELMAAGAKAGAASLPVPVFPASAPTVALKNLHGDE